MEFLRTRVARLVRRAAPEHPARHRLGSFDFGAHVGERAHHAETAWMGEPPERGPVYGAVQTISMPESTAEVWLYTRKGVPPWKSATVALRPSSTLVLPKIVSG